MNNRMKRWAAFLLALCLMTGGPWLLKTGRGEFSEKKPRSTMNFVFLKDLLSNNSMTLRLSTLEPR